VKKSTAHNQISLDHHNTEEQRMYRKETVTIENSPMEILVFEPEGDGPHPGIVVAQHLPIAHKGLEKDPFTIDIGNSLAKSGYVSVIPFLFHWWAPETDITIKRDEFRDDRSIADMDAAFHLLAEMDNVDENRIGIIGHCWGGRLSWLHACHNPQYKALVTLYGGRLKLGMGNAARPPIEMTGNIPCPVMGIFGNEDRNPSPEDVADLGVALSAANIPHEFYQYEGAGHGFQDFVDKERYREKQARDAWGKIRGFLSEHLSCK
jgi:carboxymethylenebutenolidase